MSDEVAVPGPDIEPWTGGSWEELTAGADEVFGADLEKGASLIGVPMCLISAEFRQGDFANAKTSEAGWYVSLTTIVGPEAEINRAIRRGRIPEEIQGQVEPGERLLFNEGGTGIYRQIVAYLEAKGIIRIDSELPGEGRYGESRYDVLPSQWEIREDIKNGTLKIGPDGLRSLYFSLRILCPRGLRSSEYENEYTKQGVTRYIG